ncbi:nucleotide exchange factor GrpE [bacterium]|nr:nucleotide exchange factor GrpE [bacterium]
MMADKENMESSNPFEEAQEENSEEVVETQEVDEVAEDVQEDETSKLKTELEEVNNRYLRTLAEFDNYRKRQAQEREGLLKYGASETLKKLLPVLDNIERARKSFETAEDKDMVIAGFEVIAKNLLDVLTKCGLEKIEAVDKEFDPNFHEAVSQTPTDEKPENTIVSELQAGYKMGDIVLRPTYVTVAVKPSEG